MPYREKYIRLERYLGEYKGHGNMYIGFVIGYGYCDTTAFAIQPPHMNGYSPSCGRLYGNDSHYVTGRQQVEDTSIEARKLSLRGLFNNGEAVVVVKHGMTLSHIAMFFDVTVSELSKWNNIDDPDKIYVGQKIKIVDNKLISGKHQLGQINIPPRDQGEIKPYEPNIMGMMEEWLHSPTSFDIGTAGPQYGVEQAVVKFAGRVLYGILDDLWISAQCFTVGHANAIHMNGRYTVGNETVKAGINTLTTIMPFGKVNALRKSGAGVMNGAQFNKYFKGTGINSAKQNGVFIRQHNYLERDVVAFDHLKDMNSYFSPAITKLIDENKDK